MITQGIGKEVGVGSLRNMIKNWSYPTDIRFGCGRVVELPEACNSLKINNPLLVTDRFLAKLDVSNEVYDLLDKSRLNWNVFSHVDSNPSEKNLSDAVEFFKSGKHDGVIAFGGGSALDVGKLVAFMVGQSKQVWDFEDIGEYWKRANTESIFPIIAVPTTAGTGSEVGRAGVITNSKTLEKKIIFHPKVLPTIVICDPELTIGMPKNITAGTGLDAFAHCLEAFSSPHFHPMSHGIALEGMRLVIENLPFAYASGSNVEARANMMCAAMMGATAFQKGLGAIHAMSHPIGALVNCHHGTTNAVCMPHVLRFNKAAIEDKFDNATSYLGIKGGFEGFYNFVKDFSLNLGIPANLSDLGVKSEQIEVLVEKALKDPSCQGNPVELNHNNMRALFEQALVA